MKNWFLLILLVSTGIVNAQAVRWILPAKEWYRIDTESPVITIRNLSKFTVPVDEPGVYYTYIIRSRKYDNFLFYSQRDSITTNLTVKIRCKDFWNYKMFYMCMEREGIQKWYVLHNKIKK